LFNKQIFLFIKAKYFCYSFFNLNIEVFLLCFNRLLVRYKKYFIPLAIIISFVLTGIFNITGILRIRDSYIATRLAVKVDRFLIINI
jgi:hypothetical protein